DGRGGRRRRGGGPGPGGAGRAGPRVTAIEEGMQLSRLTTVGIGGPARAFARPASAAELEEALAWAAEQNLPVRPVGLGSNLLAADEGVEALVLRLEGGLAAVDVKDTLLV